MVHYVTSSQHYRPYGRFEVVCSNKIEPSFESTLLMSCFLVMFWFLKFSQEKERVLRMVHFEPITISHIKYKSHSVKHVQEMH